MVDSKNKENKQHHYSDHEEYLDCDEYLNIYGQYSNHDVVFIVGTEKALVEIRNQIDKTLSEGKSKSEYWASDREGYQIYSRILSDEKIWDELNTPYAETDLRYGTVRYGENAINPADLFRE